MADTWYCNLQGREIGPLQLAALVQMSRNGFLNPNDQVRKGEHGIWNPASTVAGLFPTGTGRSGGDIQEVRTLEELSIDIVSSTDEPTARAATESAGRSSVGTIPTDPEVFNDVSELNLVSERSFRTSDGGSGSVPVARPQPPRGPGRTADVPSPNWYCEVFGQTMGPLPFHDLKRMVDNDELSANDRVRQGESGTWTTAVSVPGLIPEDDFELAPPVGAPSPDASVSHETPASPPPPAAPPKAAETAPPAAASSDAGSSAATETPDLNKWLDEETAGTAASLNQTTTAKTTPAKSESSAKTVKPSVTGAVSKPVAVVPRKAVPRRKKPARSRRSLGDLFAPLTEHGKLLAMIGGGILVVGVLGFFLMSHGLTFFSHDKEYYEAYLSLYQEFHSLRDQDASESQWSAFIEKANQQNKAMLEQLTATASPKNPARQFLLFVAHDNWAAMVATAREKPSIDEWRLLTNLQSAHTRIEGSAAPPKPPKLDAVSAHR